MADTLSQEIIQHLKLRGCLSDLPRPANNDDWREPELQTLMDPGYKMPPSLR